MATTTPKIPVAGIGFGGKGFWGNEHFSTLDLAEAAYEVRLAEMRKLYAAHCRFIEEPIGPVGDTLRGISFVPFNKDGRRGKRIQTVCLYVIPAIQADHYLKDLSYCMCQY
jgi:hypothetical protein